MAFIFFDLKAASSRGFHYSVLPPPFDLGHFCHQKAQFIAIKFRY